MAQSIQTERLVAVILLIWMGGCNQSGSSDSAALPQPQVDPAFYKSFYSGKAIINPESLSGVWQTDDGQGGAVGIELTLTTSVSDDVRTSAGGPEAWQALQVGVFHRTSSTIRSGEESFFSDSPQGGNVRYEDGRLALHVGWADLDLRRSAEDRWSGRLHRNDFDRQVVLTRGTQSLRKLSPFVGAWRRQVEESHFSCLHIVQTSPEAFSGWEDLHAIPGLLRYAPHLKRAPSVIQTYGKAILVSSQGRGILRLDSPELLAGCCRYSSLARLNGNVMDVQQLSQGGPWDGKDWRKMPGTSCVSIPKRLKTLLLYRR
jgi:hypothetical protein